MHGRLLVAIGALTAGSSALGCGWVVVTPSESTGGASTSSATSSGPGGAGATGGAGGTGTAPACTPGEQVPCSCPDGSSGVATCEDGGAGFGACAGCAPDVPWSKLFGAASEIVVDADDGVVVTVRLDPAVTTDTKWHLVRLDPGGDVAWDRPHTARGGPQLGADGSLRYIGRVIPGANDLLGVTVDCGACAFAARLDAVGNPSWVEAYSLADLGVPEAAGFLLPHPAKGSAADGRAALQLNAPGSYAGASTVPAVVAQVSAAGDVLWSQRITAKLGDVDIDDAVASPEGDLIVVGRTFQYTDFGDGWQPTPVVSPSGKGPDGFVVRYGPSGDIVFERMLAAPLAYQTAVGALGITLDPAGDLFLLARIEGLYDFGGGPMGNEGEARIVLAKLAGDGAYLSSSVVTGVPTTSAGALAVAAGPDGSAWVCMTAVEGQSFAGSPIGAAGSILLLRYGASGEPISAQAFPVSGSADCQQVALGPKGVPVIRGRVTGSIDFGQGVLDSGGATKTFVAKLGP